MIRQDRREGINHYGDEVLKVFGVYGNARSFSTSRAVSCLWSSIVSFTISLG